MAMRFMNPSFLVAATLAPGRVVYLRQGFHTLSSMLASWDFANPHVVTVAVGPDDIDAYEHVNNAVYLRWLDVAAWSHSAALGLSICRSPTARGCGAGWRRYASRSTTCVPR
jgi:hypothetical protein